MRISTELPRSPRWAPELLRAWLRKFNGLDNEVYVVRINPSALPEGPAWFTGTF